VADTSNATCFFIHYTSETGIQSFTENTLRLYPNPATETIHISGLPNAEYPYTIMSITGLRVQDGKTNGSIPIARLSSGIYVLELLTEKGTERMKFVIR
jgi:hypothetical protein